MKKHRELMRAVRVILLVAAFALILIALPVFRNRIMSREYATQVQKLQNEAMAERLLIEKSLDGYVDVLHAVSQFLKDGEIASAESLARLLDVEQELGVQRLAVTDRKGLMTTTDGRQIDVSEQEFFRCVLEKRAFSTDVLAANKMDEKSVVFGVPVFDTAGGLKGFLHCFVRANDFQPSQYAMQESGTHSVQIIDMSGNYIFKTATLVRKFANNNLFTSLSMMNMALPLDDIRAAMQAGQELVTEAADSDKEYILCFSPFMLNDWYIVMTLDRQSISARLDALLGGDFYLLMARILAGLVIIATVIIFSMRRRLHLALKDEIRLRNELLADTDGFMVVDLQENTVLRCTTDIIGPYDVREMSYSQFLKRIIKDRVVEEHQEMALKNMSLENMLAEYEKGNRDIRFDYPIVENGVTLWRGCSIHMETDVDKRHHLAYLVYKNIDAKKRIELLMTERADKDFLTGLLNRRAAMEQIQTFLENTSPDGVHTHAFLILDLDNFKTLNDSLGHQVGDKALQDVAAVLKHHFREYDIICRLGGDEYMVFAKDMPMEIITVNVAALLKKLCLSYGTGELSVKLTASIGVALAPMHGTDFETLYRKADRALYNVKESSKNSFCIYDQDE